MFYDKQCLFYFCVTSFYNLSIKSDLCLETERKQLMHYVKTHRGGDALKAAITSFAMSDQYKNTQLFIITKHPSNCFFFHQFFSQMTHLSTRSKSASALMKCQPNNYITLYKGRVENCFSL